ncbi:MAG: DUF3177 family protein [Oscillatoriales cyanobacterium C42_A2020_001]|nr:DUF3177 family protein [Leptolyngbyaceae cyanobacterium C42_A2020_001]
MQSPPWLPSFVWTDYRLAVLLMVLFPLALLIWAFVQKNNTIQHLLAIYWRVASLLLITVYLFIGAYPIGFISGWFARILIPLSLWFWVDLNEEVVEQPKSWLKLTFTSWRWAVSVYSIVGAIAQIPWLRCAFLPSQQVVADQACRLWLVPPWAFRELFNAGMKPYTLGLLAMLALGAYVLCLGYFVFFRLGKQGRSATEQ